MDARDEETGNANDRNRPRGSVSSFLLISLILFLLASHNGEEFLARHHYQDAVTSLENQLSNYTAWLNGTESKFTMPEPDLTVPPLLDVFHIQGHTVDTSRESYYPNITGYVRGNAQFYNITPMALEKNTSLSWRPLAERYVAGSNVTEMVEMSSTWNWTASNKMIMTLHEKKAPALQSDSSDSRDLVAVHARMEFTDAETQETLRLELDGVHFLSQGSIVGLVEPFGQPLDIRSLPSIVPPDRKNETAQIIAPELEQRITKLKNMIDDGLIDNESGKEDTPKSKCPFTFHAQFHPVPIPDYLMQDLESEIQHPTGISTVKAPKMVLSAVLLSRECGILYEIHSTQGLRSQTFFNKMTTYGGLSALAYFTALIVFSRQVERSRTPSGIPRVSRWTFLTNATIDAVCFAGHITFAILAEGRASLALMATAFLSCVLFVQEAQFAALIFQIQGPESAPSPPPPPPQTTQAAASTTGNHPSSNDPAPSPAQQRNDDPNSSFFRFFIHHVRTDPQARLWIILFLFLTVLVRVILSPALSMLFVAVTYTFIWSPQIWRSARKGRTSGLTAEYVFGTTICRLAGALYFLTCPYNVLDVEPRGWAYWLAVVVLLQAGIIVLQEHIGPSFFLPSKYQAAKLYDYHPPMPLPDSEAPEKSLGDCSICMDAIYVDPSVRPRASQDHDEKGKSKAWTGDSEGGGASLRRSSSVSGIGRNTVATANGLFNAVQRGVAASSSRREYSLAPCHHLFHTECLEKWLAIKTICPQCRRPLPPL